MFPYAFLLGEGFREAIKQAKQQRRATMFEPMRQSAEQSRWQRDPCLLKGLEQGADLRGGMGKISNPYGIGPRQSQQAL
jgi:hypothetical protein